MQERAAWDIPFYTSIAHATSTRKAPSCTTHLDSWPVIVIDRFSKFIVLLAHCIDWHTFLLRSDWMMSRGQSKIRHRQVPVGLLAHCHCHRFGNLVDLLLVSTNRTLTIINFTYHWFSHTHSMGVVTVNNLVWKYMVGNHVLKRGNSTNRRYLINSRSHMPPLWPSP